MSIEPLPNRIASLRRSETLGPGEKHVSLLWSEAVLFGKGSIDISPLRGEDRIVVLNYRDPLEEKR